MGTACVRRQPNGKSIQKSNQVLFTQSPHLRTHLNSDSSQRPSRSRFTAVDPRKGQSQVSEAPTAHISNRKKSSNDIKMIQLCLQKHSIFRSLDQDTRKLITNHMQFLTIGPREIIFQQNQPGQSFYCVASGKLQVIKQGLKKDIIRQGDSFGQLALLHDGPRTATIRTIDKCSLWSLDRDSFKEAIRRIHEQNADENRQFIQSVGILQMLTEQQKEALVDAVTPQYFNPGQTIIKQGELGNLFFIIKEGTVVCTEKQKEKRQMSKGEYFGELALLYNSARTATITAVSQVKLISIDRQHLIDVLGNNLDQVIYRNTMRIAMDRSNQLKVLSIQQKEKILDKMEILTFEQETLISQGDQKNSFIWIVLRGSIQVQGVLCNIFSCIGDKHISSSDSEIYTREVEATVKVHMGRISKQDFEEAIGGQFEQIIKFNQALQYFAQVQLFRSLPRYKITEIMSLMNTVDYENEALIVQQDTPGDQFFIIQEGQVEISKNGVPLRVIGQNDFFGQRSILFDDIRKASVTAKGPVKCWVIDKTNFNRVTTEKIRNLLMKRINLQDESIQLTDLIPVKTLGRGMFGHVYLTVHRQKNTLYSLKTVSRAKAIAYQIYQNLSLQREILLQLDHVLIMKLVKTFKDNDRLYFLMEFVDGLDLFDVMRVLRILREVDARFYVACLVTILEYLHEKNIIYRDLKPENVMIDQEGYPKLIDFGTARILKGRTYTIVGTPHYMAPEVIYGKGYSLFVDWWSLGVMLYEFLYNRLPFGEDEDEPKAIYQRILEHRLVYPSNADHMSPVRPLIQQLLSKNPSSRLGGSISKLKNHTWFITTNWNKLLTKQEKAPYIPKQRKLADQIASALNKQNDLQEFINKEEGPLEFPSRRRRPKPPPEDWDAKF